MSAETLKKDVACYFKKHWNNEKKSFPPTWPSELKNFLAEQGYEIAYLPEYIEVDPFYVVSVLENGIRLDVWFSESTSHPADHNSYTVESE